VRGDRLVIAVLVATVAFVAYTRTLLPGVDLGDTGGFQAAVLWPEITARQAYPAYYGLAAPFVRFVSPGNPARGLNLFSALLGAAAAGLLAWVVAWCTRSLAGGITAGLLLAFSYTFWTQAVIAEVYTLHLAIVALCLVALQAFAERPTRIRLAAFCTVYALGFGNHLSMILLFVPFTVFILMVHPRPRELFRPAVIVMAVAIAAAGALQYTPGFLTLWSTADAPAAWHDRVGAFWLDVTKADWRASMVFGVSPVQADERIAMWAWDARQQFGLAGLILAVVGTIRLWRISRPWLVLIGLAYAINSLFALTYNVGDSHVFFLPGHLMTAFSAGVAAAWPAHPAQTAHATRGRRLAAAVASAAVLLYAGWRAWDTWPAADRHRDHRSEGLAARTMTSVDQQNALLVSRMNWDQENALLYATRHTQRNVAWVPLLQVLPHFPFLVRDNLRIGRDIVLTANAAATVVSAYGGLFPFVEDALPPAPVLSEVAGRVPRGAPYVLTVLTPLSEYPHDPDDLERTLATLSGASPAPRTAGAAYEVFAGTAGETLTLHRAASRPFRLSTSLLGERFTIRMDAWIPIDTFRRGGFGHVLHDRVPVLFIERGVSLVWLGPDGAAETAYAGGVYAPEPRFRIPAAVTRVAAAP
jgi:hypothetical protein